MTDKEKKKGIFSSVPEFQERQHIGEIGGERVKLTSMADFMEALSKIEDQGPPKKVALESPQAYGRRMTATTRRNWKWLCLCPYCHSELNLPATTKFDKEKHKCPKCKKRFFGVSLRGFCEQVSVHEP